METASSIRYGGMLIDASECDYTSFKHLGLLCPICKRSVFLVKETDRAATERKNKDGSTSMVKASHVKSYFAHHPEVDKAIINDCELRSSNLSVADRLHLETKAHNQRRKILQSHCWKIIQTSFVLAERENCLRMIKACWVSQCVYPEKKALFAFGEMIEYFNHSIRVADVGLIAEISEDQVSYWQREHDIERSRYELKALNLPESDQAATALFLHRLGDWNNFLDKRMQVKIVVEALAFLTQKRQSHLLQELLTISLHSSVNLQSVQASTSGANAPDMDVYSNHYRGLVRSLIGADKAQIDVIFSLVVQTLIKILASVRWAYQFELLEQKDRSRDKSIVN